MNYKQQLALIGGGLGTILTTYTFFKSAVFFGKTKH